MYFLKREPRIDFLGRRGLAGIVSAVLIVIGIVSIGVRGPRLRKYMGQVR